MQRAIEVVLIFNETAWKVGEITNKLRKRAYVALMYRSIRAI